MKTSRVWPMYMLAALSLCVYPERARGQEGPYLNILGLLPMTGNAWTGGGACLPAIHMALDMVNGRPDLLAGYTLRFMLGDDQCKPGVAIYTAYEMLYTEPVKHYISGPGCSVAAETVARSSHMWNLTHLSWGGASPMLSDKATFPTFFRLGAPDTRFNVARLEMMRFFNWRKIALINVAIDYFFAVTDHFIRLIKTTAPDVHIISQEIFNQDPTTRVQYLKLKDARIIFAGGYENHGRLILCAAYHARLYGPKIVWVFPGFFADQWWQVSQDGLDCTREQMDTVAEGHILTELPFYNQHLDERGISGLNVPEFMEQFKQHELYSPESAKYEFVSGRAFDNIWGAALALNCTITHLKETGHAKTLDEFAYADGDIGDIITGCTNNLTFLGISGRIDLTKPNGEQPVIIKYVSESEVKLAGIYDLVELEHQHTEAWNFDWQNGGIQWRGGYVPRDSTQVTVVETIVPVYLYVTMSCFASLGVLLSLLLFLFNVIHRKHVFVKLSSPNINNVMLLGCVCTYTTVFMNTGETALLCNARMFTFTLGFTMAFGSLFSKTWRVYRIFSNKKLMRLKIQDHQLIGIVGALLAFLATLLVLREIVDPLQIKIYFPPSEVYTSGNDAEIRPYIRMCYSQYDSYFSWTIYVIEGVLLAFGAFLSFETRKVRIEALNDSHQIGLCLYNVIAMATVGLTLSLALDTQIVLVFGITSGFTILGTTITQLIVFIPKIMAVYYQHRVDQVTVIDGGPKSTIISNTISRLNVPGTSSFVAKQSTTGNTLTSISDCSV